MAAPKVCSSSSPHYENSVLTKHASSSQIRPPIYSLKQSKLRKRRVVRFAILYFFTLFIFLIIIIAPIVLRNTKQLDSILSGGIWDSLGVSKPSSIGLLQPLDHGLNDTVSWYTGSNIPKGYTSGSIPAASEGTGKWSI